MTVAGRDEITAMGAAEIARRIAAGDLSCGQVVEAHIQSIELVNPRLGALAVPLFERARDEALAADVARDRGVPLGRLHGVPFTVKEFFAAAGTATMLGIPGWSGRVASADSPSILRTFRVPGAIRPLLAWSLERVGQRRAARIYRDVPRRRLSLGAFWRLIEDSWRGQSRVGR